MIAGWFSNAVLVDAIIAAACLLIGGNLSLRRVRNTSAPNYPAMACLIALCTIFICGLACVQAVGIRLDGLGIFDYLIAAAIMGAATIVGAATIGALRIAPKCLERKTSALLPSSLLPSALLPEKNRIKRVSTLHRSIAAGIAHLESADDERPVEQLRVRNAHKTLVEFIAKLTTHTLLPMHTSLTLKVSG